MPEAQRRQEASPRSLPSLLAKQFLADELPEALRPTKESHRLQVAVIWGGDRLVEVRDAVPGETFTIGPKNSSVNVFQNLHSAGPLSFVHSEKDGSQHLMLPESASPMVRRNGETVAVEALVRSGQAERVDLPVKGVRYQLGLNERAELTFGELQVVARYTRPEWFKTRSFFERMDLNFMSGLVVLALAAVVGVKMMQMTPPSSRGEEDALQRARTIVDVWRPVRAPPPPKDAGVQSPKGKTGTIGNPNNKPHVAAAPPKNKNEPTKEAKLALVNKKGLLGALSAEGAAENVMGAASVEGLDRSLGNIRGAAAVADNGGLNGLGSRGDGTGGGGRGITIGGLNDGPEEGTGRGHRGGFEIPGIKKVNVPITKPHVEGLDDGYRAEIARVMRIHWNEIKYCYEKELQKNPNLEGKVGLNFDIGPTGAVTQVSVREATLDSQDAQNCIANSVHRLVFPVPKAGVVTVNYPFLFSTAR